MKRQPCTDHLGNEYASIRQMCGVYGVSPAAYRNRIRHGMTLEQALTTNRYAVSPVVGPDGKTYDGITKLCAAYGVNRQSIHKHMQNGYTFEEAMAGIAENSKKNRPPTKPTANPVTYEGRQYPSIAAACRAASADDYDVRGRMAAGYALEDAIAKNLAYKKKPPVKDPFGKEYTKQSGMCRDWHISAGVYGYYRRTGNTNPAAAACAATWPGKTAGPYKILKCIRFPWFLCNDDRNGGIVLHAEDLRKSL